MSRSACGRGVGRPVVLFALLTLALSFSLASAAPAFAGKAATGEPLFYPCTTCHPVGGEAGASRKLPNDFKGHNIVLDSHAVLGAAEQACFTCHDGPNRNPAMLRLVDGKLVDITGDIAGVCQKCHSAIYAEWQAGGHGRREAKCSSAGCHDPHTPGSIYADPLLPFQGIGFQFGVLPEKTTFMPMAAPATEPPSETPAWLAIMAAVGVVLAGGLTSRLVRGRSQR